MYKSSKVIVFCANRLKRLFDYILRSLSRLICTTFLQAAMSPLISIFGLDQYMEDYVHHRDCTKTLEDRTKNHMKKIL